VSVRGWLDERTGYRAALARLERPLPGGPSALRTLGPLLGFLFVVELVTGLVLAMHYSPSASDAWASVAYVEDQVPMGSFVRGLHRWGITAIVLVIGAHLLATAISGGYRRPRELVWWLGIVLLVLCLAYSVTGFVLRWDQYGYWATKVELAYVAEGPRPGGRVVDALQGGNDFGNLTLTRFYALHVVLLPVVTLLAWWAHRALARKHGPAGTAAARGRAWPDQALRDVLAMVIVALALAAWTIHRGGAGLEAPADATSAFDARPQWYFRPMYELQKFVGGGGKLVIALGLPVMVLGVLAALPLIDRRPVRTPHMRWGVTAGVVLLTSFLGWSIVRSYVVDDRDGGLRERHAEARKQARRARRLAVENGVPAAGGVAVFTTAPFYRARTVWQRECAACHQGDERKGPLIEAGWNDRAWIRGLLLDPGHADYFGRTKKIAAAEDAMPKTVAPAADVDALVEMVYAESGAADADPAKVARGQALFDSDDDDGDGEDDEGSCTACHERTGVESSSGPNLTGRGSPAYLAAFIRNPAEDRFYGVRDEMKAFGPDKLAEDELAAVVEYLIWLRTASPADVAKLAE
jgi:ubiquinol-cytochrome c reductase cytochrome b subunit